MTQKQIVFKVDEETVKTEKNPLTVREILILAGDTPADKFYLIRVKGNQREDLRDLNQEIELHDGDHFVAVFTGPALTS